MTWLSVLAGLLTVVSTLVSYLKDRQAIDAGTAEAVAVQLSGALDAIKKANAARDVVRSLPPDKLRDPDPDSRD